MSLRRWMCAVLTIPLLLLVTGCGGSNTNEQTAISLRTALVEAGGCRLVGEVHADCDGRLYSFTLEYDDSAPEPAISVLEPDTIAGITATVQREDARLIFEDVILDFGMPEGALKSPIMAPYLLAECLKSAYIAYTSDATDGTSVRYYYGFEDNRLEVEVVIDRASLVPKRCEIFQDGQVILSMQITAFELIDT